MKAAEEPGANTSRPLLRLRGLRKAFGHQLALDGIDLDIPEPELVGVIGPDGAGKTTLLRVLAGLLEVEATEARSLGFDLREDVTDYKANVGYVAQSFSLQRDLSILENLRFTARLHRLDDGEFEARANELLRRTALAPFRDRPAGALSGGMKQKLAIANALLVRPRLLLLDEPTAGVDVVARAEIWDMLSTARQSTLVLLSTSYLEETYACDRLLYLDDGRLMAQGTPTELCREVEMDLYRVWTEAPLQLAGAARRLPYVVATRAGGGYARVEVPRHRNPGENIVATDLRRLNGPGACFIETAATDMESTLLALARRAHERTVAHA